MSARRRPGPALRLIALAATGVVLFASAPDFRPEQAFTAVTSCGSAGVVVLVDGAGGGGGCGGGYDPVFVESAAAVGLPERGESKSVGAEKRFVLYGPVSIPGASPPTTVTRLCHLEPSSRAVLDVSCEGPDPESACTGTLTERRTW